MCKTIFQSIADTYIWVTNNIYGFMLLVNPNSGNCFVLLTYHRINPDMGKLYEGDYFGI